jgi:hypothetical protein
VVWNNTGYVSIRDLQRGAFGKETTTMFNRVATGTWQLPPLPHPEPNYPALLKEKG